MSTNLKSQFVEKSDYFILKLHTIVIIGLEDTSLCRQNGQNLHICFENPKKRETERTKREFMTINSMTINM
jgi:hypothetical protein